MSELRRVEKKVSGDWVVTTMQELKSGDFFRMFNPTGEAVVAKGVEWEVLGEPYEVINENGVKTWCVDIEDKWDDEE